MDLVIITGVSASICTALSLLPQLIKMIRTKKAEDVFYGMQIILFAGNILWIIYGCIKNDWIIIISNLVSAVLNVISACMNYKYSRKLHM